MTGRRQLSARRDPERGATAVLVAVVMLVLGAFMALVVNVAHMMDTRAQLMAASDSAALAGAMELDGTAAGLVRAHSRAQAFAQANKVDKDDVVIDLNSANDSTGDIVAGCWNIAATPATKATAFTPYPTTGTCPTVLDVNAILVRNGRDGATGHNSAMELYAAGLLGGQTSANVRASSVAIGGGPCTGCVVPFVFASCLVTDNTGALRCNQDLTFTDANTDMIGWSNLANNHSVNTNDIINLWTGAAGGMTCTGSVCCKELGTTQVGVGNGNNLTNQVADAMAPYIGTKITVPVVDIPCPGGNPQFNQINPIDGFATFTLLGVCVNTGGGGGKGKGGGGTSHNYGDCTPPPGVTNPNKMLKIRLDCDEESPRPTGCISAGTLAPRTRLVR